MKATRRTVLLAAGLLTVWGCGPPEVAPALPPGVEPVETIPEDEQAQALGEQAGVGAVQPPTPPTTEQPLAEPTKPGETKTTTGGVKYETIKSGTGEQAKSGEKVQVHYVGKLASGEQFESSRETDRPFTFRVGASEVIPGWDQGVTGMKVGEVRRLTIPPELAYGKLGSPPKIPANATLVFDIELLGIEE